MMTPTTERRRGIVLLYTLSVLMIVMSLGYAYTQASFSAAAGLGSAGFQQLAYQAALSGQAYGSSYIQQLVDARNHAGSLGGTLMYPSRDSGGCRDGFHTTSSMEPWAGREQCSYNQCGAGGEATAAVAPCPNNPGTSAVAGGTPMIPDAAWFHYGDVVVPDTNALRYRLWFRLQLNESLTRNGYFYSDERDNLNFPCGVMDAAALSSFALCPGLYVPYGMITGPFTPCGQCSSGGYMAPYPHTNKVLYTLASTGIVEADPENDNVWAPVAFARVDTGFQILLGGYLGDPAGGLCQEFKNFTFPANPSLNTRFIARTAPFEAFQRGSNLTFGQYRHAQPYIYYKELNMEVVRYGADLNRAGGPITQAGRAIDGAPPFGP